MSHFKIDLNISIIYKIKIEILIRGNQNTHKGNDINTHKATTNERTNEAKTSTKGTNKNTTKGIYTFISVQLETTKSSIA